VKREGSKLEGIVSKWFSDKGYGFVETKSGEEVFFHISQLTNAEEIQRGDKVSFTLIRARNGPKCVKVQLIS
jgi:CspA family cold shock protein